MQFYYSALETVGRGDPQYYTELWNSLSQVPGPVNWALLGGLQVVNLLVYWYLFRLFFSHGHSFGDCIVYWFTPDSWSFMHGEFGEDFFASMKLWLFFALLFALNVLEYKIALPYFS